VCGEIVWKGFGVVALWEFGLFCLGGRRKEFLAEEYERGFRLRSVQIREMNFYRTLNQNPRVLSLKIQRQKIGFLRAFFKSIPRTYHFRFLKKQIFTESSLRLFG